MKRMYGIYLSYTPGIVEEVPPPYKDGISGIVTDCTVSLVYQQLGEGPLELYMTREEIESSDLETFLDQHLRRKRDCGDYRLKRDIVVHVEEKVAIDRILGKYVEMVADGVLYPLD